MEFYSDLPNPLTPPSPLWEREITIIAFVTFLLTFVSVEVTSQSSLL
jgi:hypothetical protein